MVDFRDILDRITVRDILRDVGLDPRGSRIPCPIHGGSNPTAFSYTDGGFCCFACDAKGGLLDLAEHVYHCSRQEALERLRSLAGVPLDKSGIGMVGGCRAGAPAKWRPRNSLWSNAQYRGFQRDLSLAEAERLCWESKLKINRRLMKTAAIPLEEFHAEEQKALHGLEDIDQEVAQLKYEVNRIRKGHRYGNYSTGSGAKCVRS